MLRIILALIIGVHGLGHVLFLVSLLRIAEWGQPTRSWLPLGETGSQIIGGLLWAAVMIVFGVAVLGLVTQETWWRNTAILAALLSSIGLMIFWTNPVSSPMISALVFNLVMLVALLVIHFPSVEAVGA